MRARRRGAGGALRARSTRPEGRLAVLSKRGLLALFYLGLGAGTPLAAQEVDFQALGLRSVPVGSQLWDVVPQVRLHVGNGATETFPLEYELFVNGGIAGSKATTIRLSTLCQGPGCAGACRVTVGDQIQDGQCSLFFEQCSCTVSVAPLEGFPSVHIPPGAECKLVLDPNGLVAELDETNNQYVVSSHPVPALWALGAGILALVLVTAGTVLLLGRRLPRSS